jgi:hypothetical protein
LGVFTGLWVYAAVVLQCWVEESAAYMCSTCVRKGDAARASGRVMQQAPCTAGMPRQAPNVQMQSQFLTSALVTGSASLGCSLATPPAQPRRWLPTALLAPLLPLLAPDQLVHREGARPKALQQQQPAGRRQVDKEVQPHVRPARVSVRRRLRSGVRRLLACCRHHADGPPGRPAAACITDSEILAATLADSGLPPASTHL